MKFFILLLFFIYSNLSFALGFSDIDLKSHLGEQLLAKVDVTDTNAELDSSCFTATDIGDAPAFKKATISLKKVNNVQQLTITTYGVITEPIVSLRVSYQCEPNINREFVLLMDPVPFVAAEKAVLPEKKVTSSVDGSSTNKSTSNNKTPSTNFTSANQVNSNDLPVKKSAKKKKFNKKASTASSVDEKLMEAYTGKQQANVAVNSKPTVDVKSAPKAAGTHTDKPYLVISGGSPDANENASKPSLSLRLETQIDFARTETEPVPVATTEDADEVTVMANRLAHLEKQILSLQTRNTQLQAEAEKAKNEGFKLSEAQSRWLKYLLIGIVAVALAEWIRRKIVRSRLDKEEATWFDPEAEEDADEPKLSSSDDTYKNDSTSFGESSFNEPNYGQPVIGQNIGQSQNNNLYTDDDKQDSENVLDHADVFVVHGRPALAIQLLQNHLVDSPAESPAVWLKLLSLLADESSEADYITAVNECNQYFNIKFPSFAEAKVKNDSSIEDYQHIVSRLEGVWGSQFAVGFLNDLIYNQQSQPREGFERSTFEDLFFLKQIAEILHPESKSKAAYTPPSRQQSSNNRAEEITYSSEKITNKSSAFTEADLIPEHQRTTQLSSKDIGSADLGSVGSSNKIFSAEAFFNTNANKSAEKTSAYESVLSYKPTPSYEVDMLLEDIDEFSENRPSSTIATFKPSSDTPDVGTTDLGVALPTIDSPFVADEIDFPIAQDSMSEDEFGIESIPEIIMEEIPTENEEILLGSDEFTPKNKPKTKPEIEEKTDTNVIEFDWDLPKTNSKKI